MRILLVALLLGCLPSPLVAQGTSTSLDGWAIEVEARHRWLHGRESHRSTPFLEEHGWILIDSLVAAPGEARRVLHLRVDRPGRDTTALLVIGPHRDPLHVEAPLPPRPRSALSTSADSIRFLRSSLANGGEGVRLPESSVWDLLPLVRPRRLEAGMTWVDTVDLAAGHAGARQTIRGVRVNEVVGDTTVGGRRLWIVRDSAAVQYAERWLEPERTLDTVAVVERTVTGTLRGRSLFDSSLDVARLRADTASLTGEAVLTYPDGRSYRTPARLEQARHWTLFDPVARDERAGALGAEREARRTGMLILPTEDLERRLARGEEALRDSLLSSWRRTTDPNERARLFGLLHMWGARSRAFQDSLLRLRFEAGDTVGEVRRILSPFPSPRDPLTSAELELLLPFLDDPGVAFAFGLDRDPLYENLRQGFLAAPPALASDTSAWPCTPEACRRLAEQAADATEPRLRDLALVTRFVLEPAEWDDEILARAEAGSVLVRPAVLLLQGVGATWPAASKAPLPPPGADWRDWLEWMNGMDPDFRARFPNPPEGTRVRFEESHANAIRLFAARTGRDVAAELQRKLREASGDSARLVYDAILLGLGERQPEPVAVAERILSGSSADRDRARREMLRLFRAAEPADTPLAVELLDRLLATVVEDAAPWDALDASGAHRGPGLRRLTVGHDSVFLLADSLPRTLRDRWRDRVRIVSAGDFRDRADPVPGIHLRVSDVARIGPFVSLGIDYTVYVVRGDARTPSGYAGGITVYLVQTPDGWIRVHTSEWIT